MAKIDDNSVDDFEIEVFIKAKLMEWDKDQSGCYNAEEVSAAMQELQAVQEALAQIKWQLMGGGGIATFGIVIAVVIAVIATSVTRTTTLGEDGEMQAIDNKGIALVTTPSRTKMFSLEDALAWNEEAKRWTVDDNVLRDLQEISFTTVNDTFYKLQIAEIIRTDGELVNSELGDKLDIMTVGGHRIRLWESTGEMEVRFLGGHWELVFDHGHEHRRLGDEAKASEDENEWEEVAYDYSKKDYPVSIEPPLARRTKGHGSGWRGGVFYCVGCYPGSMNRRRHDSECRGAGGSWCYSEKHRDHYCCSGIRSAPWLILPALLLRLLASC
eukprot:gnl/TRDRNA2_/TRDRNA2_66171_c0_seq1.p1 gnl/TRDRNA2_/TRDRNA2_66171_c0~~gnl/TRDRNA2_/TRDRNA2_66171_c0_seq1.p1  ORF type:complete len:327 (-),score=53.30 gnl/TRDRNA2_/TRDRNA2_66171_c0_seq1:103-1083(-)